MFRIPTLLLSILSASLWGSGQNAFDPDTSMLGKIRNEGLQQSQVMKIALAITDQTGPRLTWSPGFDRAADQAFALFRQWGLSNIHKEEWEPKGKRWHIEKCYAAIRSPYYQNLPCTPKAWSGSTDGLVKGNLMLISTRDSAEFVNKYRGRLAGKILMFESPVPEPETTFKPLAKRFTADSLSKLSRETDPGDAVLFENDTAAMRKRISGLLQMFKTYFFSEQEWVWDFCRNEGALAIISQGNGRYGTYGADGSYNFTRHPRFKALADVTIDDDDFFRLTRLVKSGGDVQLELDVKTIMPEDPVKGYNLVAEIPGSDPQLKDELVIIGGHFDSWHGATGATDNAAGSVVMMEVMRILNKLDLPLKRTVRIVLWGGEEQGLLGSLAYVNRHVAAYSTMQPREDYNRISAYYNLDNGSGRIRGIHLQGQETLRPIFSKWLEPFQDLDASTVSIKNSGYTDHESFDLVGIPAFQFIQDELDYESMSHHTNSDNYERLSEKDLSQAATVVASLVMFTANAPQKLPRKPVPKPFGSFNFYIL